MRKNNYEIILGGDFNVDLIKNRKNEKKFRKVIEKNDLRVINIIENLDKNII